MTAKPRRRWFSFSLRTLFVLVTLLSVWLGYELKIVRERRALVTWIEQHGGYISDDSSLPPPLAFEKFTWFPRKPNLQNNFDARPPIVYTFKRPRVTSGLRWYRKWFGDREVEVIVVPIVWEKQPEVLRLDAMFPESTLFSFSF
jgi:hypothetical protein